MTDTPIPQINQIAVIDPNQPKVVKNEVVEMKDEPDGLSYRLLKSLLWKPDDAK